MSTIRITSTLSGTIDDVAHSVTGTKTINVAGCTAETLTLTGTYVVAQAPSSGSVSRALIYNEGATEIKVRILRVSATKWQYFNIPAGRAITVYNTVDSSWDTDIKEIAVKTDLGGSGRAIILQAWR